MKKYFFVFLPAFFAFIFLTSFHQFMDMDRTQDPNDVIGRWDLTVDMGGKPVPSWLEVKRSGTNTLVGYFVAHNGSARPISKIDSKDGKILFSIPPQWDQSEKDMFFEGVIKNGKISGTIISSLGERQTFTGDPAPSLVRNKKPEWGQPIRIFNGKDLTGWYSDRPDNQWVVKDGILSSPQSGANLITKEKFNDFKLHIEFRYPKFSNSGIYLRGRYEVQVQDDIGQEPSNVLFAGIYGFLTPNQMAAKPAGDWQSFDITIVGRIVTVIANGKPVIVEQIIPGITGGALDSREGEPGPIMLQGDHGPVEYRNILLTPGK